MNPIRTFDFTPTSYSITPVATSDTDPNTGLHPRSEPRQSEALGMLPSEYFDRYSEGTFGFDTAVSGADNYLS